MGVREGQNVCVGIQLYTFYFIFLFKLISHGIVPQTDLRPQFFGTFSQALSTQELLSSLGLFFLTISPNLCIICFKELQ